MEQVYRGLILLAQHSATNTTEFSMILKDLITQVDENVQKTILHEWQWLIGTDKSLVAITYTGDAFFSDTNEVVYWLDTGAGELTRVADNFFAFIKSLTNSDTSDEWLLPDLLDCLKNSGLDCQSNQVYSYKVLPVLGGKYEVSNFFCLNITEHFALTSYVHFQIKDLPDGTSISLKSTD